MSDYSQIYPYNVTPQYKEDEVGTPTTCLRCPADDSLQAILFLKDSLSIIKGSLLKSSISIKDVFVPAKEYLEYEFVLEVNSATIPASSDSSEIPETYITLNYGNLINPQDGVDFVAIIPSYGSTDLENQTLWHINLRFYGETTWRKLGRMFIWSATPDNPVPVIELQNLSSEEIPIRILIANGYF